MKKKISFTIDESDEVGTAIRLKSPTSENQGTERQSAIDTFAT